MSRRYSPLAGSQQMTPVFWLYIFYSGHAVAIIPQPYPTEADCRAAVAVVKEHKNGGGYAECIPGFWWTGPK